MTKNLIDCKNICKSFGEKKVLDDISFSIKPGRVVGLLGKNGAGKTTLLKLMNDLLTIDSGEILIDGKRIGVETKKIVSFLPERTYLDKSMSSKEIIRYFADFYEDFDTHIAEKMLIDLDIDINAKLTTLSKGMQEKIQLALVMSRKAKLYILDEPLGGVDPATRDYILDTILNNFDEGASLIISTHLISDIERILDDAIFLNDGKVFLAGEVDELRAKYKNSIDGIFRKEFRNVR